MECDRLFVVIDRLNLLNCTIEKNQRTGATCGWRARIAVRSTLAAVCQNAIDK